MVGHKGVSQRRHTKFTRTKDIWLPRPTNICLSIRLDVPRCVRVIVCTSRSKKKSKSRRSSSTRFAWSPYACSRVTSK